MHTSSVLLTTHRVRAQLVLLSGPEPNRVISLPEAGRLVIGRSGGNDIVIQERTLSACHARLEMEGDAAHLEDLGSTNGTMVNSRPIGRATLRDGDRIVMGNLSLVFRSSLEADAGGDGVTFILSEFLASRSPNGVAFEGKASRDGARDVADPEYLNLLFEVGRVTSSSAVERAVVDGVLAAIQGTVRPDRVVYQPEGAGPVEPRWLAAPGLGTCVPRIPGQALVEVRAGRTVLMRLERKRDPRDQGIRSLLCVPVCHGQAFLGSLYVDLVARDSAFDRRTAEALSAVADLLAASIVRARSEHRARGSERRLRDEETATLVGLMADGIGHDLSNTLTAILSLAQAAEDEPDRRERLPSDVVRLGESGTGTIRSLLATAARSGEHGTTFDLRPLVQDVSCLMAGRMRLAGIEIETRTPETPCFAEGNPGEIQDAVLGLCLDAKRAMPGGGKIFLSLRIAGRSNVLTISDTGRGRSPELVERLGRHTPDPSSQGFGLAHLRRAVEAHRGGIEIRSEEGRGTTVEIQLPRAGDAFTGTHHVPPGRLPRA